MDVFAIVILVAIFVEAIVQVFKGFVPEGAAVPAWLWPVVSMALGVVLCLAGKVDALSAVGLTINVPVVGQVLTGCLVSRGSNFVHDLWRRINDGPETDGK